jgi:HTH-type transcriptional regulator, sugar sensing transcriptional regulator
MDLDLIKLLEQTGFTEKEARVYLALLELGQGDVSDIAKLSDLKRSIIYVLLEGLAKRGYVSELPNKKINTFQALDPSLILRQIQTTAKNFSELLPLFKTLHNKGKKRPKITYYESREGIWKIYEEMAMTDNPFYISSYSSIEKHFPHAIQAWIDADKEKDIPDGYHLIPNSPENIAVGKRFEEAHQRVRVLPNTDDFDMDFTVFGNKLAITSLEDEPFIVVIESESLINSIRPIFEIAWKSGKEID